MTEKESITITSTWSGRYLILVFDCFLVFGIYFFKDIPSAIQSQLQRKQENCTEINGTINKSCCAECLGLGPDRYNQLYVSFFWTTKYPLYLTENVRPARTQINAVLSESVLFTLAFYSLSKGNVPMWSRGNAILVFPVGVIIDRIGNRVSSIISTSLSVIGSALFLVSVSTGVRGSDSMFILMMAGRAFIGAATGSSRIVQDRILAVWFRDKLALSFGIAVSVMRLASVLNYLLTSHISLKYGLSTAMWIGFALCCTCVISAILLNILDWYGSKKLQINEVKTSAKTTLGDIRSFPLSFWLVCIMLATFSCYFNGLISNGSKMLEDTYGFDKTTASNINGIFFDASLVFCPLSGQIYERYGLRAMFALASGFLSIPILPLILYTGVSPIIWYIILGILFSASTIVNGRLCRGVYSFSVNMDGQDNRTASWRGRYLILVFDSTLVFGIYFFTDIPSALQSQLQDKQENCSFLNGTQNKSCCAECLGLGPDRYNQLYAIYSWTNAVLVFPVGIFVDRTGNRVSSLIGTSFAVVGSVLFLVSVSSGVRGSNSMFILMMAGRLFTGAATGTSRITQDRILAVWFRDKLALSFGIVVSVLRLGSVLNFLLTSRVSLTYGLSTALWLGTALCISCFVSAIILSLLDWYGSKKLQIQEVKIPARTALRDISTFPASFWLICVILGTYYSFLNGLISNGSKMLEDTFGYDKTTASNINGILYDTSLVFCPLTGQINEQYGLRAVFPLVAGVLSIPMLPLMFFTSVTPIIWYIIMGILFAMAAISLWPAIALVVPLRNVGTGNGIAALTLHASGGLTNLAIGKILAYFEGTKHEDKQWLYVFLLLIGHLVIMTICGIILNILDTKKGYILNRPVKTTQSAELSEKEPLIQD